MSIGRNITILAFDQHVTKKELAEAAGVSQPMITKIINDEKMPSVAKLMKIAERLGVTVDDLLK